MKHILVAIDGSEAAHKAAYFAADLARQTNAQLTLLFVLEPPAAIPLAPLDAFAVTRPPPSEEAIARARAALGEILPDLPKGKVDRRVEIGHPADVIVEQGARLGADLIVIGARGLGAGRRWLLGSVSDRVVHHASCPVTVVR